ncbi:hypothetical protein ACWE42_02030 [Sutcliffiella cohnii]|uniref:Uncharacterized protein n=1 Tax=Sutcliffiella cohnii TaxID=33932 RepID=A0A223KSQ6_9BACI|nr:MULTISPECIES: hypothetical protein [Sutcliffiella]AST92531.1 hypothetical protein BC6307_15145 [Sutcliffiella cohnii]MED4019051.1 hypothetical protein [Sutcliffiella cohnii]WBL13776.1 hypothetical protein O1A01_17925 [Sutcliffiella sp. NC1]
MKLNAITLWIGVFVFGGLLLQTFIQLQGKGWTTQLEALIFIGMATVLYYLIAILYQNKAKSISLALIGITGIVGVVFIFLSPILFATH